MCLPDEPGKIRDLPIYPRKNGDMFFFWNTSCQEFLGHSVHFFTKNHGEICERTATCTTCCHAYPCIQYAIINRLTNILPFFKKCCNMYLPINSCLAMCCRSKKLAMEDLEDHVTTETLPGLVNVYSLLLKMAIEIVDLP